MHLQQQKQHTRFLINLLIQSPSLSLHLPISLSVRFLRMCICSSGSNSSSNNGSHSPIQIWIQILGFRINRFKISHFMEDDTIIIIYTLQMNDIQSNLIGVIYLYSEQSQHSEIMIRRNSISFEEALLPFFSFYFVIIGMNTLLINKC